MKQRKSFARVDSKKLLAKIVSDGLDAKGASVKSNLSVSSINRLVANDHEITRLTAEKLRQTFGEDVIYGS